MLPEKLLFHVKLLFCMVVVATEGKKKKKNRKQADEPESASMLEPGFNMCDIKTPEVIYCYCDILDIDQAEEGNCWIFNDTSENEFIWEGFMSQTKIKRLTLHLRPDGTLKSIPTVAIMHLPLIEMFEVQYATFKNVKAYSFGNSTTLSKVSLSRNSIATLARNAFTHLPSLDTLSLGENHISEINRHVFADLPKLTRLYIDRNNITIVHDRAFQGLHSLLEIDLFSNQIHVITPDTFKGLQSLVRLDLHKNRIEVIGDKTFRDLQALRVLDLQENSLKYIAPNGFFGLGQLQHLNLQDNKLLTLGAEVLRPTPGILHLDIRANVLETLTLETMQPLIENLNNDTMQFFLEGNNFRCDKRLSWMFSLRNSTRSMTVRRNLDEVICYLEGTTMPPRLAEDETVTPVYETTTLGIEGRKGEYPCRRPEKNCGTADFAGGKTGWPRGSSVFGGPMMRLLALREAELPDPMTRWMQTADPEDCPEEEGAEGSPQSTTKEEEDKSGRRRGNRVRNGRKRANQKNKAQNDMAPVDNDVQPEPGRPFADAQPPAPVQESRSHSGTTTAASWLSSGPLLLALCLLMLHATPH